MKYKKIHLSDYIPKDDEYYNNLCFGKKLINEQF